MQTRWCCRGGVVKIEGWEESERLNAGIGWVDCNFKSVKMCVELMLKLEVCPDYTSAST